ncbi:MAG: M13 family metallopeptidase [Muribaculaceae bacterium]|nr:M13 family metallopeptidase [Muribaculaceae bacterium]
MNKVLFLSLACAFSMTINAQTTKGVDAKNLDLSVSPSENFYQYACGGWMKNNPLDPQYARFGSFDQLAENTREQVKDIITNLGTGHTKGSLKQKVGDLYALGMDTVRLNNEGFQALKADLETIKEAKRADFAKIIGWLHNGIAGPFFDSQVMSDLKNSEVNLLYFSQGGLGMGDRDYYLENDESTVKIRQAYNDYIARLFELVGYKKGDAKKMAKNVMSIEVALAQVAMTREETRDYSKMYNIVSLDDFKNNYSNINWDAYFAQVGVNGFGKVCVMQLNSIAKANELLGTLKEDAIRDYLQFKYIDAAAPYLSDNFVQANFDMYSKAMSGTKVQQPRWKRALNVPNSLLGEAVGQLYVEKYFPADSKKKMLTLVNNLKCALGEHIAALSWMSAETKVNALVKLNSFKVKIGYPDKWRDYSDIDIDFAKPYWTNVMAARMSSAKFEYSQLNKPVDKERWWMTPQTVNAYYDPSANEICFPAGILQAPYFDPTADDACNYGAIGVVIGHEMTHGFDDQGRNFDQNGNMTDWWTETDAQNFKALSDKLVAQYSEVIVADDVHANGEFTLGENIADHGGLRVAYTAFKKTSQGKSANLLDGFTPDQRFYLSYANVWAANITHEEILRRTKTDPHSLGINRVNVAVRNLTPFFEAFNIKEGDKMFRPVHDRVEIW